MIFQFGLQNKAATDFRFLFSSTRFITTTKCIAHLTNQAANLNHLKLKFLTILEECIIISKSFKWILAYWEFY